MTPSDRSEDRSQPPRFRRQIKAVSVRWDQSRQIRRLRYKMTGIKGDDYMSAVKQINTQYRRHAHTNVRDSQAGGKRNVRQVNRSSEYDY
jgi:hypothetical protein